MFVGLLLDSRTLEENYVIDNEKNVRVFIQSKSICVSG